MWCGFRREKTNLAKTLQIMKQGFQLAKRIGHRKGEIYYKVQWCGKSDGCQNLLLPLSVMDLLNAMSGFPPNFHFSVCFSYSLSSFPPSSHPLVFLSFFTASHFIFYKFFNFSLILSSPAHSSSISQMGNLLLSIKPYNVHLSHSLISP